MAINLQTDAILSTTATTDQTAPWPIGRSAVPDSAHVSGIEIRLSRVLVKDNHTPRVGPFPGRADVYLLVVIFDDLMQEPQTLSLEGFQGVNDDDALLVDRTVYYWKKDDSSRPPSQIHVLVSLLKSKKQLRNTAQVLAAAKTSAPYQNLVSQVAGAIATAPTQAVNLILQLGTTVGSLLTDVEDRTLFTQVASFTDLNGDFDAVGKTAHEQQNHYVATTLTVVVRDADRVPATPQA
ncbi:hypothetical protein F0P96_10730 [Hymenobacter busanensis]|uniref:Uncharacterized protein n=1 Tax=Hymenobacter busanensis TaxID=2607656 RepID=A0A7L5A0F1_9BACT|nr:hypothetical protein [Hymenobacter busanensis]KAA9333435.1 hypothetical protein F0P96_10730 [Hymenobacter busanensis]QHJ07882.1 hypothetical protein GUY19_11560 [Hymenobacter busanensis]